MSGYWNLSEKDRATLTYEQVGDFTAHELMTRGVLPAGELILEPEPTLPEPTHPVYRVILSEYDKLDIAFDTAGQAEDFLALAPHVIKREWVSGADPHFVVRISKAKIVSEMFLTEDELRASRSDISRAHTIRETNQKRKSEHKAAVEAEQTATLDMWNDYWRCSEKAKRLKKVADTYLDYVRTAGSDELAVKFLQKVFVREEIVEAAEWHGVAIVLPPESESEPVADIAIMAGRITSKTKAQAAETEPF